MSQCRLLRAALRNTVLLVLVLLPSLALAGWGDENWGEMIWGGGAPAIPSASVWARLALVVALLAVAGRRSMRRHVRS